MGFWDVLDVLLETAIEVLHEISKDRPFHITNWIDSVQEAGAASAYLKRKGKNGVHLVAGAAFDSAGNCIDKQTWQIDGNTGFKKLLNGDNSGLGEIFDWKDEITYTLAVDDEDDELYFISKDYKQSGPFNSDQLLAMLSNGTISYDYYICVAGNSDWEPIGNIFSDEDDIEEDIDDEDDIEDDDEDIDDEDEEEYYDDEDDEFEDDDFDDEE